MLRRVLSGVIFFHVFGVLTASAAQFVEAPQFQAGTNPQGVAVGDFNGDNKLDLAVVNSTSNTISILLGNGDGTYQARKDYVTGTTPQGIAIADYSGDGVLDIAVTDSASDSVSILLGNGDGTFQTKVDYATGNKPIGIAVGDFNGDGNPDLVVTNAKDDSVGILLGNGNGTFKAPASYSTGFNPCSVVVGDFNGDGKLDIATANNNGNAKNMVSVFVGKGDGTFSNQLQYGTGNHPISIATGDVNGDGKLDLVVANQVSNSVSVLLGNGDGSFQANVDYGTAPFPTSVAVGDFRGDGFLDIAVTAGNGNTVSVLLGNGDGTFKPQNSWGVGDIPYAIVAADVDRDNKLDLVVANSGDDNVSVVMGNGDGTFQTRLDYAAGPNPNWVATGDFNGDGIVDLAVVTNNCPVYPSCGPGSISIVLGNGDGTFQPPSLYSTGSNTDPYSAAVADLNGDGKLDLAVTNYATGTVSVMLGVGDGTFPTHVDYPVASEPTSVSIADLNNDSKPDLVVSNFHSNSVSVLIGNGDGSFKVAQSYATGNGPISVAAADFNGDHTLDLVVVNETDNNVSVLLGNGDGTFKPQLTYSTGAGGNPLSVIVGDFDRDGSLDLAVADFHTQQVSVLLGNGDGTFQAVKAYPTGANPSSVVMADFNSDGKVDLALTSTPLASAPGNVVSLLLGNGDGTFSAPAVFGTGSEAYSAAVADFNGDGAADLAVANGISNTVSILLNARGTRIGVVSSGNPSFYGQAATFTATVNASVNGTPTGSVNFLDGSTSLGSSPLNGAGIATLTTTSLSLGSHNITAAYKGDSNFNARTSPALMQVVQTGNTSAALLSSQNPSSYGQSIVLTAQISSASSGSPTGTVTFSCGNTTLGSVAVNSNGVATLSTATLPVGTDSITAAYGGDGSFSAATSSPMGQVVQKANSTTALSYSANLKLVANVTPATSGMTTGSVTFMDGKTQLGTAQLDASGTAIFTTSALPAGVNSMSAAFSGDGNFNASTSQPVNVTADFNIAASAMSPPSLTAGQTSTSEITITPLNGFDLLGVGLMCSIAPQVTPPATCYVGSLSFTNGTGTAALTVSTTADAAARASLGSMRPSGLAIALALVMPALLFSNALGRGQSRRSLSLAIFALVLAGSLFQAACAGGTSTSSGDGGKQSGTPSGNYTITLTGTANETQHTTTTSLTVK